MIDKYKILIEGVAGRGIRAAVAQAPGSFVTLVTLPITEHQNRMPCHFCGKQDMANREDMYELGLPVKHVYSDGWEHVYFNICGRCKQVLAEVLVYQEEKGTNA